MASGQVADLTDAAATAAPVDQVLADFGPIDVLGNNAGLALEGAPESFAPLTQRQDADWRHHPDDLAQTPRY